MPDRDSGFAYDVRFADETKKGFRDLGHSARADIPAAIQKKLTTHPLDYGEPLGRDLAGYRKLPVGQRRVVYFVEEKKVLVLVLAVGKRSVGDRENIYDHVTGDDVNARRAALRQRIEQETGRRGES